MADLKAPPRSLKSVKADVQKLLSSSLSDQELLQALTPLSEQPVFGGLTWLWGPELYRRNRVLFRPFILQHFSSGYFDPGSGYHAIEWTGEAAKPLDAWLVEVDTADDVQLFRRLFPLKHRSNDWGGMEEGFWRSELLRRFRSSATPAAREIVLRKMDFGQRLDESTALALYELDRSASTPFILRHLPHEWGDGRKLWRGLFAAAQGAGDQQFAFQLYRRQIEYKKWSAEAIALAERVADPAELCEELERRHPDGWDVQIERGITKLVQQRGEAVLPYVRKHLKTIFRPWGDERGSYDSLVRLAAERGWWDFWSALVRTCGRPDDFNSQIEAILKNSSLGPHEQTRRLMLLSGVSREWNFGPFGLAQVHQLTDETALLMYGTFPELLRGPFRRNISVGWNLMLPKLTSRLLEVNDEDLIDYLASRLATRELFPSAWNQELIDVAEKMSRYYEPLQNDEQTFTRRAATVLGQIPAYSIFNYNNLIRTNRLARLLYDRSAKRLLADPAVMRDLLEAPEIHVQALAFRALGLNQPAARRLAAANVDLLLATLLRPLHRKTRMLAFGALANAATDQATARRIHERCRDALSLPDQKYPKEQLVGLIGRLLSDWPVLRGGREQPTIYSAQPA